MSIIEVITNSFIPILWDILPIVIIIAVFQLIVIRKPFPNFKRIVTGFIYGIIGLVLFLEGLELSLFPLGKLMATQLTDPGFITGGPGIEGGHLDWIDYYWVYIFAALIGFSSAIAEPALIAVALQARKVSGGAISVWGLRSAVAVGVAFAVALGAFRIITGTPLHYYIIAGYIFVIIQTFFAPKMIIPLAYDSGGVTTSTVTVPLIVALGLGLANTVPGRSQLIDGFGMIALACLFPIISVIAYAQISLFLGNRRRKLEDQEN